MKNKIKKRGVGGIPKYSLALKIAVVKEVLLGELSYGQVAEKFKLAGGRDVVNGFVRWYKKNNPEEYSTPLPTLTERESLDNEKLKMRIKGLETELKASQLKVIGLETMIEVAEKTFGRNIKKKSGSKRLKK